MRRLVDKVLGAAKHYTLWDFGLLKVCLITLGILLGIYFSKYLASYLTVIWIIFIFSYLFIMYKTFVKYIKK